MVTGAIRGFDLYVDGVQLNVGTLNSEDKINNRFLIRSAPPMIYRDHHVQGQNNNLHLHKIVKKINLQHINLNNTKRLPKLDEG